MSVYYCSQIRVLELAGLAPAPFAGKVLSDFGADVIRIDRAQPAPYPDVLSAGKRSVVLDFKQPTGVEAFKHMVKKSDCVIDPYRPTVLETLGLGPDTLFQINPMVVVARLTGFGQPETSRVPDFVHRAGHDINFLALSGMLSVSLSILSSFVKQVLISSKQTFGDKGSPPMPPLNILGDFAGGGLACAFGIVSALLQRHQTGKGAVVDTNMVG